MNTFLLKTGCLVLFGFIFFLSFQAENDTTNNQPLLGHQEPTEFVKQHPVAIAADAINHTIVQIEAQKDYRKDSFDK